MLPCVSLNAERFPLLPCSHSRRFLPCEANCKRFQIPLLSEPTRPQPLCRDLDELRYWCMQLFYFHAPCVRFGTKLPPHTPRFTRRNLFRGLKIFNQPQKQCWPRHLFIPRLRRAATRLNIEFCVVLF